MTALKFGLAVPYGSARVAPELAAQAEDAGWDGCFLGDAIWCEDPMIALAAAAMSTRRIRPGTMIIPMTAAPTLVDQIYYPRKPEGQVVARIRQGPPRLE